jgi:predicted alpha/beta superfamily hydrolase
VGGAPKFLGVIVDELIPQLAKQFPIDTAQLGLFGVSAGGFFVSWAIFQDKSPFKSYLISSPAMAYGDGAIFREEARYAASHKDLHVSVFVATGSLEFDDPYLEGIGKIASGHAQFVAALRGRKYPNLKLNNEIMNGMGHGDSAPAALVRGMRTLYGKP